MERVGEEKPGVYYNAVHICYPDIFVSVLESLDDSRAIPLRGFAKARETLEATLRETSVKNISFGVKYLEDQIFAIKELIHAGVEKIWEENPELRQKVYAKCKEVISQQVLNLGYHGNVVAWNEQNIYFVPNQASSEILIRTNYFCSQVKSPFKSMVHDQVEWIWVMEEGKHVRHSKNRNKRIYKGVIITRSVVGTLRQILGSEADLGFELVRLERNEEWESGTYQLPYVGI